MIASVITDERTVAFGIAGLVAWGATLLFLAGYGLHWGIERYKAHRFAKRMSENLAELTAEQVRGGAFTDNVRRFPTQLHLVGNEVDDAVFGPAFHRFDRPDGAA